MGLTVRLLGPPRVARDGAAVGFETRKAMALLAVLALSELPRSREALCELLYPGHDPDRARGALRRTLSALRTGIGAENLEVGSAGVALATAHLDLDVARFRELSGPDADADQLAQAIVLCAGPFLDGFGLRDSPEFDDWQQVERVALDRELASVLRRRIAHLVATARFEEAVPLARRWLGLDPLHEPAQRELIRLHALSGDRAAALEQYRACVRVLSEELGVSPVAETTALFEQVYDGALVAPVPDLAPPPVGAARAADLPLVGREAELATLVGLLEDPGDDGTVVVVEGEAGVGKTRLTEELVAGAGRTGATALTTRCHDDEAGLPYGPIVDLLRQAVRAHADDGWLTAVEDHSLADAALLLPALGRLRPDLPAPLPLNGPGGPVRLLDAVSSVLTAACAGAGRGVVVLDDIHLADAATLDTVAYLARRLQERRLVLAVCWRSEAVPPGHRLRRLASGPRTTVLRPRRLDEDQVAGLVRERMPEQATPELERRVFEESEGLPLFVDEYLRALAAGGPSDGLLTAELRTLLDRRVAGLGDIALQVLGAAAAIGRSFDFDTLRQASGRSEDEALRALDDLVACGIVREASSSEDTFDFSHSKLRELAYEQMGPARRRLLHRRIAAAVLTPDHAAPQRDGQSAGRAAAHLRLAGDVAGAAEQHRLAAEHAVSVHAHADALEHLEATLALGLPDVAGVHERIGDLRTLTGDYAGALAAYDAAVAFGDVASRARLDHKAGEVHQRRGDRERAELRFNAALDGVGPDQPGLRARVLADLGLTLHRAAETDRAAALAREALELAGVAGDRRAQAQAHNLLGVIARSAGDLDAASRHLRQSREIAAGLGDGPAEAAALNNLALVVHDGGQVEAALELTGQALSLCAHYGDRHREAALENNLADLHHAAGDEAQAMHHLKRAVSLFAEVGADEATRMPEIWKLVSW